MEINPVIRFENVSDIPPYLSKFALKGRRSLDIFTHALAPVLYENPEVIKAISSFTRSSGLSRLRIIVRNIKHLYGVDCPLISLCRRLPSHAKVKVYTEGAEDPDMGFFCVDQRHLVYFNDEANFVGFAREDAKAESKHALEEFNQLWVHGSKEDPNLRRLSL